MKLPWLSVPRALLIFSVSCSSMADVMVSDAWARSTFKFATSGAAYMQLHNMQDHKVAITGASVSSAVAAKVEFHETRMEGEVAKMRPLTLPLTIAADEHLAFVPGGKHIMLMGLNGPLNTGERFTLSLAFADGSEQEIEVLIQDVKSEENAHHHH